MQGGGGWVSIDLALEKLSYPYLTASTERRGLEECRVQPAEPRTCFSFVFGCVISHFSLRALLSLCFAFQFNTLMCAISSSFSSY